MKRFFVSTFLALAVAWIPAVSRAGDSADETAIKNLGAEFVAAWNAHDPARMAGVWAEDADLINPFGVKARGRAEIQKLFEREQHGVMRASTYEIGSMSVHPLCGDAALVDWAADLTGMVAPDGKALPPFHHHVSQVVVKKGGHWRVEFVRAFAYAPLPPASK
jgi:uncharacterized protein (TIGR02246 family)